MYLGLKYNISSDILNAYSAELGEINNFGGSVNPMNAPSESVTLATKGHTGAIDQANTAWNVSCSRISITIHIFLKNSPGIESDWNNLCNNVIKYSDAVVASRSGGGSIHHNNIDLGKQAGSLENDMNALITKIMNL